MSKYISEYIIKQQQTLVTNDMVYVRLYMCHWYPKKCENTCPWAKFPIGKTSLSVCTTEGKGKCNTSCNLFLLVHKGTHNNKCHKSE